MEFGRAVVLFFSPMGRGGVNGKRSVEEDGGLQNEMWGEELKILRFSLDLINRDSHDTRTYALWIFRQFISLK